MAATATATQNQNVQLIKTFIIAFGAVLLALPIVTVITASIVQAQFGGLVHAAAETPTSQVNSLAGPSCAIPAEEQQANAQEKAAQANSGNFVAKVWKSLPVINQTNNSTSNSTTTNTSNVEIKNNGNTDNRWSGNTNIDSRFSGNTLSLTDNRNSGNTNTDSRHYQYTNISDNGNTNTDNRNSGNTNISDNGNTDNSNSGNTNVNTNVNTNIIATSDNDGIDLN